MGRKKHKGKKKKGGPKWAHKEEDSSDNSDTEEVCHLSPTNVDDVTENDFAGDSKDKAHSDPSTDPIGASVNPDDPPSIGLEGHTLLQEIDDKVYAKIVERILTKYGYFPGSQPTTINLSILLTANQSVIFADQNYERQLLGLQTALRLVQLRPPSKDADHVQDEKSIARFNERLVCGILTSIAACCAIEQYYDHAAIAEHAARMRDLICPFFPHLSTISLDFEDLPGRCLEKSKKDKKAVHTANKGVKNRAKIGEVSSEVVTRSSADSVFERAIATAVEQAIISGAETGKTQNFSKEEIVCAIEQAINSGVETGNKQAVSQSKKRAKINHTKIPSNSSSGTSHPQSPPNGINHSIKVIATTGSAGAELDDVRMNKKNARFYENSSLEPSSVHLVANSVPTDETSNGPNDESNNSEVENVIVQFENLDINENSHSEEVVIENSIKVQVQEVNCTVGRESTIADQGSNPSRQQLSVRKKKK